MEVELKMKYICKAEKCEFKTKTGLCRVRDISCIDISFEHKIMVK